ncbi:FtsX-like permease family protein [Allosphingosinicella deserti]|uniref:ABC transporter permease n=1 Tax=Allosphingosinicella deserti TaxID=2116704 RepID=A0A2P7QZB9_9SPHN|nr:FtsX-like permease family protein [Sphingomonas deserti]PSJ43310.1 ABC transporter permease [Sphingomonas deserti]
MRTIFLASLRTFGRRYIAAQIAVSASVALIVVIGVLIAGARAGIMAADGAPYRKADYVIRAPKDDPQRRPSCCPGTLNTAAAIDLIARLGENASGLGRVALPLRRQDGAPLRSGNLRDETTVGPIANAKELRWQALVTGRLPAGIGEVVLHVWDANAMNIAIGDRILVGEGPTVAPLEVVGFVESPTTWTQASMYVTWRQYLQWRDHPTFHIGSVAVRGKIGRLPQGMTAYAPEAYVTESLARLNNGTDALALLLLLFVCVALFISIMVVANTFSILFAQRCRDFALLRCVGATKRQVTSSVWREAAVIALVASAAGTLIGVALGYGLIPLVNALAPRTPMGFPRFPAFWLLGASALGLVVTMIASLVPTRRAVQMSPLAAMRPDVPVDIHTAPGRFQLALAVALLVTGLVSLAFAMIEDSKVLMVAGGASVIVTILLIGPLFIPPMVTACGTLLGRYGRLAAANAARNPRRTATTTTALLIGVTMTTAVLTGLATWRTAIDAHRDTRLPIDVALTSLNKPISTTLLTQVRQTAGVEHAIAVNGAVARMTGLDAPIPVLAARNAEQVARDGGRFTKVAPGTIALDLDSFASRGGTLRIRPGSRVTVRVGNRQADLRVVLLSGWGKAGVIAPETLKLLTDSPEPHVIWARGSRGANWLQLVDDLDELADATGGTIEDRLQARAAGNRQLDVLEWSALGLLGISVAIALVGIANTLGLSVLERARENALLRALGLTRKQLRQILAAEALLLSVVATLLGMSIGIVFAWVGFETFVVRALRAATMEVPWISLSVVMLVVALAGLLSSIIPGRQAAAVPPAAGLLLD